MLQYLQELQAPAAPPEAPLPLAPAPTAAPSKPPGRLSSHQPFLDYSGWKLQVSRSPSTLRALCFSLCVPFSPSGPFPQPSTGTPPWFLPWKEEPPPPPPHLLSIPWSLHHLFWKPSGTSVVEPTFRESKLSQVAEVMACDGTNMQEPLVKSSRSWDKFLWI